MTMSRIKNHWRWWVFAALLVLVPLGVWAGTWTPVANGAAAAGSGPGLSFEDHVHPLGTTSSAAVNFDTTVSAAGQNFRAASGANATGEYGFVAGTNAIVSDGTQVFAAGSDLDGTPLYNFTVAASGDILLDLTALVGAQKLRHGAEEVPGGALGLRHAELILELAVQCQHV